MGLLSAIGNLAKNVVSAVLPTTKKIENTVQVLLQSPAKQAIPIVNLLPVPKASPITANVSNPALKTALETVANHPYAAAAVVAAPIAIAKSPAVATVAKNIVTSVAPKTVVGKVATVAAVPIVAGAIARQPIETISAVTALPSGLANFGGNVAQVAANPTLENAAKVFKENPVIAGATVAATVAAVGLGTSALLSNIANTAAVKENTKVMQTEGINISPTSNLLPQTSSITGAALPAASVSSPQTPTLPQTQIVRVGGTTSSTRRRKRTSKAVMPSIRQNVNVLVQNRNSSTGIRQTKRYLNKEIILS